MSTPHNQNGQEPPRDDNSEHTSDYSSQPPASSGDSSQGSGYSGYGDTSGQSQQSGYPSYGDSSGQEGYSYGNQPPYGQSQYSTPSYGQQPQYGNYQYANQQYGAPQNYGPPEDTAPRQPRAKESAGFFRALFDFNFDYFVSTRYAKFVYGLVVILVILAFLMAWLIPTFTFFSESVGAGVISLIFGWIPPAVFGLLNIIGARFILEFIYASVITAENTTTVARYAKELDK